MVSSAIRKVIPAYAFAVRPSGVDGELQSVEGYAGVAVGHVHQKLEGVGIQTQLQVSQTPLGSCHGPFHQGSHLLLGKLSEGENPGTG